MTLAFTPQGQRDLSKLPRNIQLRIKQKLLFYISRPNPLTEAKRLVDLLPHTHRFQIGKYRASFFIQENTIMIDRVELRGHAYRRR